MYMSAHSNTLVTFQAIQTSWLSVNNYWMAKKMWPIHTTGIAFGCKEAWSTVHAATWVHWTPKSTAQTPTNCIALFMYTEQAHSWSHKVDWLVVARRQEGIETDCLWVRLVECSGAMEWFYRIFPPNVDISVERVYLSYTPMYEWHTPRLQYP